MLQPLLWTKNKQKQIKHNNKKQETKNYLTWRRGGWGMDLEIMKSKRRNKKNNERTKNKQIIENKRKKQKWMIEKNKLDEKHNKPPKNLLKRGLGEKPNPVKLREMACLSPYVLFLTTEKSPPPKKKNTNRNKKMPNHPAPPPKKKQKYTRMHVVRTCPSLTLSKNSLKPNKSRHFL